MKVRLLQAWKIWPEGHEFPDMPPNVASDLIRRKIAEEVAVVEVPARKRAGMRAGRDYVTR